MAMPFVPPTRPISFFFGQPAEGDRSILISNLTKLHMDNQAQVCISRGVFQHCTGSAPNHPAPLIALNPIVVYGLNKLEYIIEAALRLMAKNPAYTADRATLLTTVDDDDLSKKILFNHRGKRFVAHLFWMGNVWCFIVCLATED